LKRAVLAAVALGAVLALPFLARSRVAVPLAASDAMAAETLVILTPHNEAIRSELGRAFRAYMAKLGRRVEVDWRSPGGSAEITRYLVSQYAASFEQHWTRELGRKWSAKIASAFAQPSAADATSASPTPSTSTSISARAAPSPSETSPPAEDEGVVARRAFLASHVSAGVDLLFGGGSTELARHAAAGRLVDSGILQRHPDWFGSGEGAIPEEMSGEPYWDRDGRWVGVCLSSFGICFNRDALARLHVASPPASWRALGDPVYHAEVALADPTKSASVSTAFEMIIQSQMNEARRAVEAAGMTDGAALDRLATRTGWTDAMRVIRRIGANARYFTDSATKVPLDVSTGDAAAGMCIDFYGRFQSESAQASGRGARMGFVTARGETAINADPIGLLRGAPHPELALTFIEFVLSEDGQKLWNFRPGTPGGPERYSLRRLPIRPRLYDHAFDAYRADPDENPYKDVGGFVYREAFTGRLSSTIAFVVRVMCVDPARELEEAYRALIAAGFPPRATALFDDVSLVDHAAVAGPVRAAVQSSDPLDAARMAIRLVGRFRDQYRDVAALAREGR
jgi:iron(III) transport system substrate-binding protein